MSFKINYNDTTYPLQDTWKSKKCWVSPHYNPKLQVMGEIVRDDKDAPNITIIKLSNGQYLLSTECMITLINEKEP